MALARSVLVTSPLELSVVVACRRPGPALAEVLGALRTACGGISAEILLACAGSWLPASDLLAAAPEARAISGPADALVPDLWGLGLREARGGVTAFTTAEFLVSRTWARALLDSLGSGATGAGGAIALGERASVVDRAVYFLRYSAFQPPLDDGPVGEIPGDNAAYRSDALRRHSGSMAGGFWEVDFHRRIRREGGTLRIARDATATFRSGGTLPERLRERFRHGRHSGAYRAGPLGHPWWRGVLAAPLVPALLAARVLRRAARAGRLGSALGGLPALLPLAGAWALGEAVGALGARTGRAAE
jgi:hypothetical protein